MTSLKYKTNMQKLFKVLKPELLIIKKIMNNSILD